MMSVLPNRVVAIRLSRWKPKPKVFDSFFPSFEEGVHPLSEFEKHPDRRLADIQRIGRPKSWQVEVRTLRDESPILCAEPDSLAQQEVRTAAIDKRRLLLRLNANLSSL